jgi:hypothetical protein
MPAIGVGKGWPGLIVLINALRFFTTVLDPRRRFLAVMFACRP